MKAAFRALLDRLHLHFGKRATILVALFLVLWMAIWYIPRLSFWFDAGILDQIQRIGAPRRTPHPDLILVSIDSESLEQIPARWPWPRSEFARLLATIARGRPKAVIWDIILQHTEGPGPSEGDLELARVMKSVPGLALVSIMEEFATPQGKLSRHSRNEKLFREAAGSEGIVRGILDSDGIMRSFTVRETSLGEESCVLKVFKTLASGVGEVPPVPGPNEGLISFATKEHPIPQVRVCDLLSGAIPPEELNGRIVVVGATALALHDFHPTSLGVQAGPEILAASLDTLLGNRFASRHQGTGWRFLTALLGATGATIAFGLRTSRPWLTAILGAFGTTGLLVALSIISMNFFPLGPFLLSWVVVFSVLYGAGLFLEFIDYRLVKAEAEAGGEIQTQFFPKEDWRSEKGYWCRGMCIPCEEVGGDYYDFLAQPDGSLVFLMADVAGHGFAAALVTTIAKTVVEMANLAGNTEPGRLLTSLGNLIFRLSRKKRAMTAVVGHLDTEKNLVNVVSAGHLPPVLIRKDGTLVALESPSFPLGITQRVILKPKEVGMEPGDTLVLYTDGIIEAFNWDGKMYTFERWYSFLQNTLPQLSGDFDITRLLLEVREHTSGRPFADDVTLLIIKRLEAAPNPEPQK